MNEVGQLTGLLDKLMELCDKESAEDSQRYPADIELLADTVGALVKPLIIYDLSFAPASIIVSQIVLCSFVLGVKRGKAIRIMPLQFVEIEDAED